MQAEPAGQRRQLPGQAGRVEPAGVVDDLDAAVEAGAEHRLELGEHRPGVAGVGILLPGLPQDEHGQLGEVVTGEHVDGAALDHLPGRLHAVAVEPGGVADPDRAAGSGAVGLLHVSFLPLRALLASARPLGALAAPETGGARAGRPGECLRDARSTAARWRR